MAVTSRGTGQGGKSLGGAGILGLLGERLMWTEDCSCAYKSQRQETPIVKWGWKHLWHRSQAAEPKSCSCQFQCPFGLLSLGGALTNPHGHLGPCKIGAAYRSPAEHGHQMSSPQSHSPSGRMPVAGSDPSSRGRSKGHHQPQPRESSTQEELHQWQIYTKSFLNTNRQNII